LAKDLQLMAVWSSKLIAANTPSTKKPGRSATRRGPLVGNSGDAKPDPMPHWVKPMLATLVAKPFDRPGWIFEVKWDGFRAIAEIEKGKAVLTQSQPFEERFPPIVKSLARLKHDAIIDGEIAVVGDNGQARFELLQAYHKAGGALVFYVFDVLYLDGKDLRGFPLVQRKQLLEGLVRNLPNVRYSDHIEHNGIAFYEAARQQGLEGIIAKQADSPYRPGVRTEYWLKIKIRQQQEAVIGGFTEPRGGRQNLGAVVLGVYEGDDLV
jgi:bifunctional non-homologous end joining protein LigD